MAGTAEVAAAVQGVAWRHLKRHKDDITTVRIEGAKLQLL